MDRSKIRPLKTICLKSRPLTSHALAWSCDAELAVATDDIIYIFLPEYPRSSRLDDGGEDDDRQAQFSLSFRASGLIRPDPAINAQLCAFSGIKVVAPPANDENWFPGVGSGLVTGSGASVCQVVHLEWSPNGLGCNMRPILLAMSTSGALIALGENIDRQSTMLSGMRTRGFKAWKTLWGLGAQLPLPDPTVEGGYRNMNERIQSFSWAKELDKGRALLAYSNDTEEIAIMSIQLYSRPRSTEPGLEDNVWDLQEVARFNGKGLHTKEDATDITDPDFVPHGSAFSLEWSPWLVEDGGRSAILAYTAKNYVGFRRVVVHGQWEHGQLPRVEVGDTDVTSICTYLSTDAFVRWEDTICSEEAKPVARGVIGTPFDVKPFQVALTDIAQQSREPHYTWECETTYSKETEIPSLNPITGILVHPRSPASQAPVPYYSLVRSSATAKNQDWYQTNLPETEASIPQWADKIRKRTTRMVTRAVALEGLDSDSDSEDDFLEETSSKLQVPESRYRIWGVATSPGGGVSAVLVSHYSTQLPERRGLCEVRFGWRERGDGNNNRDPPYPLTTEGQVWEWMYSDGPEAPGTSKLSKPSQGVHDSPLRQQFQHAAMSQRCVFCYGGLHMEGNEARCVNGHVFARCASTGLAIMGPDISRICAVCELRCLKVSELTRISKEHFGLEAVIESSGEVCGGCGGKFVA